MALTTNKLTDWERNFKFFQEYLKKNYNRNLGIVISVIIPVYNEEDTIRAVLERIPNSKGMEVIVVDDHSTDNSVKEIEKVKNRLNLKLIKHSRNKGYGGALLTGIKHASGKIIVTMDSDGQHQPEDVFGLVRPILENKADIVIGSRYLGSYNYKLPFINRLGELLVEIFLKVLFGHRIMNNQGGFRAFAKKTLNIFKDIKFKDYAFTTELLLKASLKKYRIREVPIHLNERKYGTSKIVLKDLLLSLLSCGAYYLLKRINDPHSKKYLIKRIEFMKKLSNIYEVKKIETLHTVPEKIVLIA